MIAVHCEECDCWVNNDGAYDIMWTLASPCEENHVYHFCCLPCLEKWVKDDLKFSEEEPLADWEKELIAETRRAADDRR